MLGYGVQRQALVVILAFGLIAVSCGSASRAASGSAPDVPGGINAGMGISDEYENRSVVAGPGVLGGINAGMGISDEYENRNAPALDEP